MSSPVSSDMGGRSASREMGAGKTILRVICAFLLGIVANAAGGFLFTLLESMRPGISQSLPWVAGAANHVGMMIAALLLILLLSRGQIGDYGFRLPTRIRWGALVLWSAGISALVAVIGELIPGEGLTFMEEYSLLEEIAFVWILASIAEEVLTRGLVQGFLAPVSRRGIRIGTLFVSLPVLVGAVFFGAMHLMLFTIGIDTPTVLLIVVFAFALGLVAGYYRERSGSLIPAFAAHALANVTGAALELITGA